MITYIIVTSTTTKHRAEIVKIRPQPYFSFRQAIKPLEGQCIDGLAKLLQIFCLSQVSSKTRIQFETFEIVFACAVYSHRRFVYYSVLKQSQEHFS